MCLSGRSRSGGVFICNAPVIGMDKAINVGGIRLLQFGNGSRTEGEPEIKLGGNSVGDSGGEKSFACMLLQAYPSGREYSSSQVSLAQKALRPDKSIVMRFDMPQEVRDLVIAESVNMATCLPICNSVVLN
jgi:hypothetical protein